MSQMGNFHRLFIGKIFHKRFRPSTNEFTYKVPYILIDIDRSKKLTESLFSFEGINVFSFYKKDHGFKDERDLRSWAEHVLNESELKEEPDRILLQTFPRFMGFVFNPVSFWYCYKDNKLISIISEVNNTFGESYNYVIKSNKSSLEKNFHVSPFYSLDGRYDFDFSAQNKVIINYFKNDELELTTSIEGEEREFKANSFLRLIFQFPFFTLQIVFLIHWQALKLFAKKNKFYSKPDKPKEGISYERCSSTKSY